METKLFTIASILFVLLVITLFSLIMYGLQYAMQKAGWERGKRKKIFGYVLAGFVSWFVFTGILAANGFFMQFSSMPPRLPVLLVPPMVFIVALTMSSSFAQLLRQIPQSWLMYIQSFRILMEIILWMAFIDYVIPVQMTFEGLNYDIAVGLTAPVFAYFCFTRNSWPRAVAIGWNIGGLALLLNIVVISILSAPVPFRVFMNEPANTFVAELPFVWLAAFVVPVAYWMHILSLKQLLTRSKVSYVHE